MTGDFLLTIDRPTGEPARVVDFYAWVVTTKDGEEHILIAQDFKPRQSRKLERAEQHREEVAARWPHGARLVKLEVHSVQ